MRSRPLFIGGAGRSGTTLAVDLLGTHEVLSPVYETDFVLQVARELLRRRPLAEVATAVRAIMDRWTAPLPLRPHNKRDHERYLHGPHHVLFDRATALEATEVLLRGLSADPVGAFRTFVEGLFERHAALDGKPRWVNKTPAYVGALPFLHHVWPDLLFVHCVRDGRDVARSVLTRPWGPSTWGEAGAWWRDQVLPALTFADAHPGSVLVLPYERLLAQPEASIAPVLAAAGLDGAERTVARYLASGAELDPARTGGWVAEAEDDLAAFEVAGAPTLRALGYEPAASVS